MADNFQIVNVDGPSGATSVLHPETNADQIKNTMNKRVPTQAEMTQFQRTTDDVNSASLDQVNLTLKMTELNTRTIPTNMLNSFLSIDGAGSGLDSDFVDGCGVNDSTTTSTNLWTAAKINTELGGKVNTTDVVSSASGGAGKILKLNSSGVLPASITGNAPTADRASTCGTADYAKTVLDAGSNPVAISTADVNGVLWMSQTVKNAFTAADNTLLNTANTNLNNAVNIINAKTYVDSNANKDLVVFDAFRIKHVEATLNNVSSISLVFDKPFATTCLYTTCDLMVTNTQGAEEHLLAGKTVTRTGVTYTFNKQCTGSISVVAFGY